MKEKLYTIELTDALQSGDECPFCYIERNLEQAAIEFVLGSSYMESDMRDQTDRMGFCQKHTKKMFDYGNALGNAWILKSRLEYLRLGLIPQMANAKPGKSVPVWRRNKSSGEAGGPPSWIREEESHCYICGTINETYERVLDTFVHMLRHEPDFMAMISQSKGFCVHHFADLWDVCERKLNQKEKEQLFPVLSAQMEKELSRIQEDIDWFIEKYDYRNADADWKTSKDAVQRTMQKLVGGHPADPVFQNRK